MGNSGMVAFWEAQGPQTEGGPMRKLQLQTSPPVSFGLQQSNFIEAQDQPLLVCLLNAKKGKIESKMTSVVKAS
jgi:hypothetical protein